MTPYGVDALAFGPHPDDAELFCGGTLIRLAELGYNPFPEAHAFEPLVP